MWKLCSISSTVEYNAFCKNVCYAYFGIKLGDQDKALTPHRLCCNCVSSLRQWSTGEQKYLAFGIPMV